jgi:hypothetical protein
VLSANRADVPFALIYLVDANGIAHLTARAGIPDGSPVTFAIAPDDGEAPWPVQAVAETRVAQLVSSLSDLLDSVPPGPSTTRLMRGSCSGPCSKRRARR